MTNAEKERLKKLERMHLILETIAAIGSIISIGAILWQALH